MTGMVNDQVNPGVIYASTVDSQIIVFESKTPMSKPNNAECKSKSFYAHGFSYWQGEAYFQKQPGCEEYRSSQH
jgi:hypothetical protein